MGFLLSMVASTLSHQLFFSGFGGRSNWLVTPSVREVLAPRLWSLGKMIRHPFGRESMIVHALRAFACNNQTHPQCFTMVHVPRPTNPWSLQWRRSIFGHGLQGVESMTSYRRYVGPCRTKIDIIDQSLPIINYCNLFVKRWSQSEGKKPPCHGVVWFWGDSMVKHALFGWVDEDDPVKKLTKETRYFAKEDAVGFQSLSIHSNQMKYCKM